MDLLLLLSALEEFAIDQHWGLAWKMTGQVDPPFAEWKRQDVNQMRKEMVHARLMEPSWVGAMISELKDEDWLVKKRASIKGKGKGKEKGGEKAE